MEVQEYRGKSDVPVKFPELARCPVPVEATVCYGKRRLVFKGTFAFTRTRGSWKYGDQLKIDLFGSEEPRVEVRAVNKGWTRIEIEVPLEEGRKMLEDAVEALDQRLAKFIEW